MRVLGGVVLECEAVKQEAGVQIHAKAEIWLEISAPQTKRVIMTTLMIYTVGGKISQRGRRIAIVCHD